MPSFDTFAAFTLASVLLILLPGPNLIYIVTRGIAQGRRAALMSALGVEVGTLVHIIAAALGVSVILARSATAFTTVKFVGAAYLIYLGIKAFRGDDAIKIGETATRDEASPLALFGRGVLVNVLNPKVAIFFLAFFPQFIDPQSGPAFFQILTLGLVFFVLALALDVTYALLATRVGHWLRARPRILRHQRFVAGSVYVGLGAAAALSGADGNTGK